MNDQPRCKFVATDQPRVLPGRHREECPEDGCGGCLPCPMLHCRRCGVTHSEGACAGCLADVRESLSDVVRMYAALPEEVEHRGVEGEAMVLLGPASDPEAWGHVAASVASGRLPLDWQVELGQHHPLSVLASWQDVYADAWDQENTGRATVVDAAGYLARNLDRAGQEPWVPFEEFARDVSACASHLERVLHDGEQVDRGAPCMTCRQSLQRTWGATSKQDGWKCPGCHQTSTEDQYRFAVAHLHREEATHLTDRDMEIRTGVKAGTVRVWAQRELIVRQRDAGRTVYSVAEVEAVARARGLLAS